MSASDRTRAPGPPASRPHATVRHPSTTPPPARPAGRSYGSGARILSIGIAATGLLTFAFFSIASHVLSTKAAERVDVQYLAGSPITAKVNFTANTITRTDGGNWLTDGFAVGQTILVSSSAKNSTVGATFYTVTAVSPTVLTLSLSDTIVAEATAAAPEALKVQHIFAYKMTAAQTTTLTSHIREWTPAELLNTFNAGLLKSVTDTVITVGGRQSNHARLTAAAAARLGLRCELVLTQLVPRLDEDYQYNGNILLDDLFGAHVHDLPGTANALDQANERAALLRAEGRRVYVTPAGGSSPVGCLGYAVCAHEILAQSQAMGVAFDRILVPNGSSGTHAGLAAGLVAMGVSPSLVRSFAVLATEEDTRATTIEKTRETLQGLGQELSFDDAEIDVVGSERGTGYGMPTPSMLAALDLMASREGLLLDPVYSGKAFAGLLAAIRNGDYRSGQNILFVMTGGTPGLFAYRDALAGRRI